jgi:hypothetical protein
MKYSIGMNEILKCDLPLTLHSDKYESALQMSENYRLFIIVLKQLYLDSQAVTASYFGTPAHCGRQS